MYISYIIYEDSATNLTICIIYKYINSKKKKWKKKWYNGSGYKGRALCETHFPAESPSAPSLTPFSRCFSFSHSPYISHSSLKPWREPNTGRCLRASHLHITLKCCCVCLQFQERFRRRIPGSVKLANGLRWLPMSVVECVSGNLEFGFRFFVYIYISSFFLNEDKRLIEPSFKRICVYYFLEFNICFWLI